MVKKALSNQKGASSVLVMLVMLVLVVFGVAALTTALASLRLGQKAADWSDAYYRAEGEAARHWAQIDAAVSRADEDALPFRQALDEELAALDIGATLSEDGDAITYEVWDDDMGLHATLALDMEAAPRLRATQWYQIQK
jgi:Tfp pilus assembly protein PilX